ncbi:hypothetical protein NC653_030910 [Populus alba x Populus x berolinensis]|uniref:Uncharacterized protein n=1 Tax=Populus alba x Populus x berolinensis TaxID=444605 RepID=A0AAD6LX60_9ROSI|nr:hypothetical protein NC653_030910 [Populus alba x Populus x berolinensis]
MTSLKGHVCNSNIPEETLNPILKSLARTPSLLLHSLFHFNYGFLSSISTASLILRLRGLIDSKRDEINSLTKSKGIQNTRCPIWSRLSLRERSITCLLCSFLLGIYRCILLCWNVGSKFTILHSKSMNSGFSLVYPIGQGFPLPSMGNLLPSQQIA